jgi:hypothetical protein
LGPLCFLREQPLNVRAWPPGAAKRRIGHRKLFSSP